MERELGKDLEQGKNYDGAKKDLGRFEEESRICYRKVL